MLTRNFDVHRHRNGKRGKMKLSKGRAGKAGPKSKSKLKKVDDDLEEGLGRAHNEDFLGLEDNSSDGEEDSDEEDQNPVFNLKVRNELKFLWGNFNDFFFGFFLVRGDFESQLAP